jgi:hypothetical protein
MLFLFYASTGRHRTPQTVIFIEYGLNLDVQMIYIV